MNKWIRFGLGLAISVASMAWALKDSKLKETWAEVVASSWGKTLVIYFFVLASIHIFRTLRWGNLLSGIEKVPFKQLNEASAIGFMMLVCCRFAWASSRGPS